MAEVEAMRAVLADLAAEYAADLPALIEELTALVEAAAANPATLPRAVAAAHRLRGTAGSYGFAAVGEAAGLVEEALEAAYDGGSGPRPAGAATAPALVRALAALVPRPP